MWRFGSEQVRVAVDGVKERIAERSALRQEQIESQRAGEPAIPDGGVLIQDPAITELVTRDGQEVLTGGSVPIAYFAQSDPAWKDQPYGSDSVGPYGCGPTAMAMAVKSLTGTDTDPKQMPAGVVKTDIGLPEAGHIIASCVVWPMPLGWNAFLQVL